MDDQLLSLLRFVLVTAHLNGFDFIMKLGAFDFDQLDLQLHGNETRTSGLLVVLQPVFGIRMPT